MPPVVLTRGSLRLDSRLQVQIENYYDQTPLVAGMLAQCDAYKQKFRDADHTRGCASAIFNCHGLTFAARRTQIWDPAVVRKILEEDDYQKIAAYSDVKIGDIVIYLAKNGDIDHSGIVVKKEQFGPLILSKWGACQEVIHMVGDCPYDGIGVEYYRVTK